MVSIVLPNLNTPITFLRERLDTIILQTYQEWECIVIDGYSTNGSWEILSEVAKTDQRFKTFQFPKRGIYAAWNSGIELARGKYIYIATSDDTMSRDCIAKLVRALQLNPQCDIAHCSLAIIDDTGQLMADRDWNMFYPARYFGEVIQKPHIRLAPYDGILHCALKTLYTSITQLLITKELFDRIGMFLSDQGTIADFEWGMRAGLTANIYHLPEYLASWRIHSEQATSDSIQWNPATYAKLRFFIDHAFKVARQSGMDNNFPVSRLKEMYWREEIRLSIAGSPSMLEKVRVYLKYFFHVPIVISKMFVRKVRGRDVNELDWARNQITKLHLTDHLILEVL